MKPFGSLRYILVLASFLLPSTAMTVDNVEVESLRKKSKKPLASMPLVRPRIQETRGFGGAVSEIKINNKGSIPSYYIYPSQHEQDSVVNNRPDMDISTPNWQIKW